MAALGFVEYVYFSLRIDFDLVALFTVDLSINISEDPMILALIFLRGKKKKRKKI